MRRGEWVADSMRERFDSQLLAIAPYPPQIVFCRDEVTSLADLEGQARCAVRAA